MSDKKETAKQNKTNLQIKEEKKSNCGCGCVPLSKSTQKSSSAK